MEVETARKYFCQSQVVDHYAQAANRVGLWVSEEKIFTRLFNWDDSLLELGCGAGRIAIGLWEIGYRRITAVDYSREMVAEARRINEGFEYGVFFHHGDATRLKYEDETYEGAIFGFNGLMQIPGRENRRRAMREIHRVLVPGSWFVFTTHDRDSHWRKSFWREQKQLWNEGRQHPDLEMFGDLYYEAPEGGMMFIHTPTCEEIREDLKAAGFRVEADTLRHQIANEPPVVRDFADECRFWVAQKPGHAPGP
ncbi:class I SAM-dependent methyltransferase [Ruficoccus amylovorans]|uniref:Class I SAM-dependent methyltransferase n=1 Tax=Ruficoccus amylovorans TaxID=1804625 RepID=A0A842HJP6_9BACT|nr:class I SAM-dependent methyltransferase [Ruficoccus amylovorans]MBC2595381.1 class I SAM-dependent methyltransferase [Ruficoccus amylovorans]